MEDREMTDIYNELWSLGIAATYAGFFYAGYVAFLTVNQPECLPFVTKWLYPAVARRYKTTAGVVERDIRTVVEVAWREHSDTLEQFARRRLEKKPTASQLISILAYGARNGRAA